MTADTVWPTFDAYRACRACDHGGDDRVCKRPEVRYLTINGLDYSKETV